MKGVRTIVRRRQDDQERRNNPLRKTLRNSAKVVGAASAVAAFNRSDLGYMMHEALPALDRTIKNVTRDVSDSRGKAIDIKNALSEHVGKNFNVLRKSISESRAEKLSFNSLDKNTLAGAIRNLKEASSDENLRSILKRARHDAYLHSQTSDPSRPGWNQFIKSAYSNIESVYIPPTRGEVGSTASLHQKKTKEFYEEELKNLNNLEAIHKKKTSMKNDMNSFLNRQENVKARRDMAKAIYNKNNIEKQTRGSIINRASQKTTWFRDNKSGKFGSLEEWITGGRTATLADVKNNLHLFKDEKYIDAQGKAVHVKNLVNEWTRAGVSDDTIFDKTLKIRTTGMFKGKMYSTKTFQNIVDKAKGELAYTIPGRLFKMQDLLEAERNPSVAVLRAGKKAFAAGNSVNNILQNTKLVIGNNLYDLTQDQSGNFAFNSDAIRKDGKLVSYKFGSREKTARMLLGSDFEASNQSKNKIMKAMDVWQTRGDSNIKKATDYIKDTLKKDKDVQGRSAIDVYLQTLRGSGQDFGQIIEETSQAYGLTKADVVASVVEGMKDMNRMFNDYTNLNKVEKSTINKMKKNGIFTDARSQNLLNIYDKVANGEDMDVVMNALSDYVTTTKRGATYSQDLNNAMRSYRKNASEFLNTVEVSSSKQLEFSTLEIGSTEAVSARDMLKKEILKEALLSQNASNDTMVSLEKSLKEIGLGGKELHSVSVLNNWGIHQSLSASDKSASAFNLETITSTEILKYTSNIYSKDTDLNSNFLNSVKIAKKEVKEASKNVTDIHYDELSEFDYIKKSGVKDMLKAAFNIKNDVFDIVNTLSPTVAGTIDKIGNNVKNKLVQKGNSIFDKFVDTYNAVESNAHETAKELKNVNFKDIKDTLKQKDTRNIVQFFDKTESGQAIKNAIDTIIEPVKKVDDYLGATSTERKISDIKNNFNVIKLIKSEAKSLADGVDAVKAETIVDELTSNFKKIDVRKIIERENVKTLAKASKSVFEEAFLAGRNNPDAVSDLTFRVFNAVNRLNLGLNNSLVALSSQSSASTLDLVKNVALKRILPAMMIYNTASYLNFESRAITGTSLGGYAANIGKATDVGTRRLLSPILPIIGGLKKSSIFAEYMTGSNDVMSADEREDWYENGYSPVRRGSGWMFSSSSIKGSDISYYKPNYWRLAHSNYYDVSVYGSSDEKWKHSPLPSLRHPLSPLVWATDRYWLEKKNFADRPYPLTGKMFEEGTPWGSVLNATIGRVLKPQRMLPQARRALHGGMKSVDARSIIERENEELLDRASNNDDAIILNGTDVKNAQVTEYGNPYSNEINIINGRIAGRGKLNSATVLGITNKNALVARASNNVNFGYDYSDDSAGFGASGGLGTTGNANDGMYRMGFTARNIVGGINKAINAMANATNTKGAQNGMLQGASMANFMNMSDASIDFKNLIKAQNSNAEFYHSKHMDGKYIGTNKTVDAFRDIGYSASQLSGVYRFIAKNMFGSRGYKFRYANAGAMTSTTKRMWESQTLGGGLLGNLVAGDSLEIIRRFIPNSNSSVIDVNPLANSMPMWIPEQYRTGDPYASVKMGDARMPGRGYETLNKLHSDNFGRYGAFDRFKILGDIAPGSEEYKTWRGIAKRTITDPALKLEMEKIEERAYKSSSKYEFYEYSYLNRTKLHQGVVQSINQDGTVTLANGQQIKMAGVKGVQMNSVAEEFKSGDNITYRTSAHAAMDANNITKAIIYKSSGGFAENVNKLLGDRKLAKNDYEDQGGLARRSKSSEMSQAMGLAPLQELLAHAQIPFIHNMFFNMQSSEESWKNDMVYGRSFKTWDHPIRSYIAPAINRARGQSFFQRGLAISAMHMYNHYGNQLENKLARAGAALAMGTFAPDAYAIGAAGWMMKMNSSGNYFQKGAKAMSTVSTGLWAISQLNNPLKSTVAFGALSGNIAHSFETSEAWKWATTSNMIGIGAVAGLGLSAIKTRMFTSDQTFKAWAPHSTKKKWAMDEYFDRLEYIKYHGLYKQSLQRANENGENIQGFFNKLDKNKEEMRKLKRIQNRRRSHLSEDKALTDRKISSLQRKIDSLKAEQQVFTGSDNAKSAVAYRKAMESTIYGLDENSTLDEILSAVPDQDKDHFKAFMNEDDKKKRKRILKYVPKYLENPLRVAWGMNTRHIKKNSHYFGLLSGKKLPKAKWRGWNPNVNLKYVKMKTIQNEGMLLSDFGFYDSERAKASYQVAPGIHDISGPTHWIASGFGIGNKMKLESVLRGQGLQNVSVDVTQSSGAGLSVIAQTFDTIEDKRKSTTYEALNAMKMLPFV